MTEVEKRFLEQAIRDINEQNKSLIAEGFNELVTEEAAKQEAEEAAPQSQE